MARGQNVDANAVLVRIDNPETIARHEQAVAAKVVADAQLVLFGQAARGLLLQDSARPFAALAGLAVLFALLTLLRLRSLAAGIGLEELPPQPAPPAAAPRSIGQAFAAEWRRVLGMSGPFVILVIAPLMWPGLLQHFTLFALAGLRGPA